MKTMKPPKNNNSITICFKQSPAPAAVPGQGLNV